MWKSFRNMRRQVKDIIQLITRRKRGVERGNGQPSTLQVGPTGPHVIADRNYCQCNIRGHLRHSVAHIRTFPNTYTVSFSFFKTSLFRKHAFIVYNEHPSFIHDFIILPQVNLCITKMCANEQYARIKPK